MREKREKKPEKPVEGSTAAAAAEDCMLFIQVVCQSDSLTGRREEVQNSFSSS